MSFSSSPKGTPTTGVVEHPPPPVSYNNERPYCATKTNEIRWSSSKNGWIVPWFSWHQCDWNLLRLLKENEETALASQEQWKKPGGSGGFWQIFSILLIPQTGSPKNSFKKRLHSMYQFFKCYPGCFGTLYVVHRPYLYIYIFITTAAATKPHFWQTTGC